MVNCSLSSVFVFCPSAFVLFKARVIKFLTKFYNVLISNVLSRVIRSPRVIKNSANYPLVNSLFSALYANKGNEVMTFLKKMYCNLYRMNSSIPYFIPYRELTTLITQLPYLPQLKKIRSCN